PEYGIPISSVLRKITLDYHSLENAKLDNDSTHTIWIKEDYCSSPLLMEREVVLDKYLDNIKVEIVHTEEEGWNRIKDKRSL
ncbi:MAG: hypothetical protein L0H55_11685, partial [Candidatus Nitrosocosmicus sp.]|nr:hypothetical protein [Candidatus Nitrosocosmicus sp.]